MNIIKLTRRDKLAIFYFKLKAIFQPKLWLNPHSTHSDELEEMIFKHVYRAEKPYSMHKIDQSDSYRKISYRFGDRSPYLLAFDRRFDDKMAIFNLTVRGVDDSMLRDYSPTRWFALATDYQIKRHARLMREKVENEKRAKLNDAAEKVKLALTDEIIDRSAL